MTKALLWLAVGLAAIVAGWLLLAPHALRSEWQVHAALPYIVGDSIDPFVYNGGDALRPVLGSADVRLSGDGTGAIRLSIEAPDPTTPLTLRDGSVVGPTWELVSSVDDSNDLWFDTLVHGDTGIGDGRLPETRAWIAASSRFDLTVGRDRRWSDLSGFWSAADALRQDDGSIRQQGLVFSPLLRDKTGFSDPERLELTLLLYEDGPGSDVLAHVVFTDVAIERSPTLTEPGTD